MHGSTALAGACWTQLTDTYQEVNGLLGMDRVPKVDIEALRRATLGEPEAPPAPPAPPALPTAPTQPTHLSPS